MPEMPLLRIGEAAKRSGVSAANIRFYEKHGLLPAAQRQDNAYRCYSAADVHRLRFIRMCRAMDMSLEEVARLLHLNWDDAQDCQAASQTVDAHLEHVRQRLAELHALEQELQALQQRCSGHLQASGHCALLAALHAQADHDHWQALEPESGAKRHV